MGTTMEPVGIEKIIAGGQTGADRAALDFAIERGNPHGGWCPRGRRAEDGIIPPRFRLRETPSIGYSQRTEWNVRDSDGTVIFTIADRLQGGSATTARFARKYGKPCLHLAAVRPGVDHAAVLRWFVQRHKIKVLNVAGPRGSDEPTVARFVTSTLRDALTGKRSAKRTLCALVVDDDSFVRQLYRALLSGFRVLEAGTSEQALGVARGRTIDLVVTDFVRPGRLNGLQFITEIKKTHPFVPVIMASGYYAGTFKRQALRLGACASLSKPFSAETFLAAVDDALFHPAVKAAVGR